MTGTSIAELALKHRESFMKNLLLGLALAAALAGCSRVGSDTLNITVGTDVSIKKKDGAGVE